MDTTMLQKIEDGRTDLIIDYLENESFQGNYKSLMKYAAYYGDVTAVKYLIRKGADIKDLGTNLDLNGAAFHNHWQLCQFLLEQGADASLAKDDNGETALHSALSKANSKRTYQVAHLLLSYNANPNAKTLPNKESGAFMRDAKTHGETPLHRAAAFGSVEVIDLLLEYGADTNAEDQNGNTPLSWASWHLRPGIILSKLMHSGQKLHPLHIERLKSDHGFGYGAGTMHGLIGKAHIK